MKPSSRITVIASGMLVVCLAASVVTLRKIDTIRKGATLEEVLYITSPKVLKRLSLGYNGLLADIYWTRAVQYFGRNFHDETGKYTLLAPLLEITTALDPQLIVAYEYGANFLAPAVPGGAGMPEQAIELTEYGIRNNPDNWRLYYDLGFIYYQDLKDYKKAAEAFERGSEVPGAHPWLKLLAALMAEHAGDIQTSRLLWTATYENSADKNIRANAAAHLRALQVDQDVPALEELASKYHERTGHWPGSFRELAEAGMIPGMPVDPLGKPYKLMADGRVVVGDPDDLPFIQKGIPEGYKPPPKPKVLPIE
ncbi:MAG TPA: tetratricopeptide repeat protein [Terriglobales bacterium]